MSPASRSVSQGSATTSRVATWVVSGSAESVTLSTSGLPAGSTATFNPNTVRAGGSSTITVRTSASTPAGTSTITVTGKAASAKHTASFRLAVNRAPIVSGAAYEILQAGQAVDDPGSSTRAGTQLIVWREQGSSNQRWIVTAVGDGTFTIKNRRSGLCIDDADSSTSAGTRIIQWRCTGARNQRWRLAASGLGYTLTDQRSQLVITAAGRVNGSALTQQPNTNAALQKWTLTNVG